MVDLKVDQVVAEAVDVRGRVLMSSAVASVTKEILPPKAKAHKVDGEDGAVKLVDQQPLVQEKEPPQTSQWEKHMILKHDRYYRSGI